MNQEPTDKRQAQSPSHYVVELRQDGKHQYVLCESLLTVNGGEDIGGLPIDMVAQMFERAPLRAVELPTGRGDGGRWLARGGGWPQSGHNININLNFPPEP